MDLIYPLSKKVESYDKGKEGSFGFRRWSRDKNGQPIPRKHAGVDLYADAGTPVLCMTDCIIQRIAPFYKPIASEDRWVYGVETESIQEPGFIIRYCEVDEPDLKIGKKIKQGDTIGLIGFIPGQSMLHLEMYTGYKSGPLYDPGDPKGYKRRGDLINPAPYLRLARFI